MGFYLKITATDKTSTLISENAGLIMTLLAPTKVDNVAIAARITGVTYTGGSATSIPQYTGSNTYYQFGRLTEHGQIETIHSNA